MTGIDLAVALMIAVGIVGVFVPGLPGSALVAAAVVLWAIAAGTTTGWVVLAIALSFLCCGLVVKYALPGKRLRTNGIPGSTLVLGGLLGVVGFFVVPLVGLPLGFVLGVYLAELRRLHDHRAAWQATVHAVRAAGLAMLIEFAATFLAALVWGVGVIIS